MTPTELWDIYYHALKRWLPTYSDAEIRKCVNELMDLSVKMVWLPLDARKYTEKELEDKYYEFKKEKEDLDSQTKDNK